jgi:1,4-alpha-glucan branching enzyme
MGYTYIELLPVTEYPYDGSWGYQATGYFAPTARYGEPDGLRYFVDRCHKAGIGVILDWVPGHFCRDEHGLGKFNGEKLYELYDHKQWGTYIFDFGRTEVRSFLLSSACFWLEVYHADGLHLGNANTLLYLDSGRRPGEWLPNPQGGRERAEGIAFLRELNEQAGGQFPGIQMSVGETAGWSRVTRATAEGGLGFDLQWDEQTPRQLLEYLNHDPFFRKFHHDLPLARGDRAFAEHTVSLKGRTLSHRLKGSGINGECFFQIKYREIRRSTFLQPAF